MTGEMLQKARLLSDVGRHDQAGALVRSHLASEPSDAEAWRLLAALEVDRGDLAGAHEAATRSVGLDPSSEWGQRLLSVALEGLGRTDEAVAAAREAVRLAPWAAGTHERLAYALTARAGRLGSFPTFNVARHGRLREARRSAERAVELAPRTAGAHFVLGYVRHAAGRHRPAVRAYERVLALDPQHAAAHNNLGALRLETFSIGRTARSLRASLELDPHGPEARENLEALASRGLWVGWLLVTVLNGLLLVSSVLVSWPWRALATVAVMAVLTFAARRFFQLFTRDQVRHLARRLPRRWPTWLFGPLLLLGLAATLGFLVLPTHAARTLGEVYVGESMAGARIAWLGMIVAAVVAWVRRK